jgi:hypothetical protein
VLAGREPKTVGPDGVTVEQYRRGREARLHSLYMLLKSGGYRPGPVKHVRVNEDGRWRDIFVQSIDDAVVDRAVLQVIEPLFEPGFHPQSWGFRPGRSIPQVMRRIQADIEAGWTCFLRADVQDCFARMDPDFALALIFDVVQDESLRALITAIVKRAKADIWSKHKGFMDIEGIRLGSNLSPLICNIYNTAIDRFLSTIPGIRFFRYADDLIVLARPSAAPLDALDRLDNLYDRLTDFMAASYPGAYTLNVHKSYTSVADPDCLVRGPRPLIFLGLQFDRGRDPALSGKKILGLFHDLFAAKDPCRSYRAVRRTYGGYAVEGIETALHEVELIIREVAATIDGAAELPTINHALTVCAAKHRRRKAELLAIKKAIDTGRGFLAPYDTPDNRPVWVVDDCLRQDPEWVADEEVIPVFPPYGETEAAPSSPSTHPFGSRSTPGNINEAAQRRFVRSHPAASACGGDTSRLGRPHRR